EPCGSAGPEDAILATYIADCEDRLLRQELRWQPEPSRRGDRRDEVDATAARIDELLLGPAAPGFAAYAEALSVARSLLPHRTLQGAAGGAIARGLRALRG